MIYTFRLFDILAELPSSKVRGRNILPPPKNRRLLQFEWVGGGVYYTLMKVKRNQDEYVHLAKAFLGDKTVFAHEVCNSFAYFLLPPVYLRILRSVIFEMAESKPTGQMHPLMFTVKENAVNIFGTLVQCFSESNLSIDFCCCSN